MVRQVGKSASGCLHNLAKMYLTIRILWIVVHYQKHLLGKRSQNIFILQIMEVCYGTMTACEIAYYTYIYAKVDKKHYQIVTSHMRGASLTGRFTSALTSQIALYFNMTIGDLNYFTLGGKFFNFHSVITIFSNVSTIWNSMYKVYKTLPLFSTKLKKICTYMIPAISFYCMKFGEFLYKAL